jgi:hypothetical protein
LAELGLPDQYAGPNSAAKIRSLNSNGDVDKFNLHNFGQQVASDPVASRSYSRLQDQGTDVILDFGEEGSYLLGEAFPNRNEVNIYVKNNRSTREAISTMVHESSHIDRHLRGIPQNTRYEEYVAFRREFLFQQGRRPTLQERSGIWETVNELYSYLQVGRSPF